MAEAAEVKEEVQEEEARFIVELDETIIAEVEETVVKANSGKAKEELAEEIEAAKTARLEDVKKENKAIIAKAEELAKAEDNAEKTDEEIMALAQAAIAEASENDEEDSTLTGFFGQGKSDSKAPEGSGGKASKVDIPQEVQAELDEYRKFKEDQGFLAYVEAKKSGDIEFIDVITQSGLAFDPKQVTPDQLKQYQLNKLKEADPTITNEEIEEIMSEFADKSRIEKVQETLPIRAQLEAERREALKAFSTKVTSDATASRESVVQVVQAAENELKNNYLGVEIFPSKVVDEEMMLKVMNTIRTRGITAKTKEGKPDVKQAIEEQLIMLNYSDSLSAAYLRGRKDAEKKFNIRTGKPSGLKMRSSSAKKQSADPRAALLEAQKARGMV